MTGISNGMYIPNCNWNIPNTVTYPAIQNFANQVDGEDIGLMGAVLAPSIYLAMEGTHKLLLNPTAAKNAYQNTSKIFDQYAKTRTFKDLSFMQKGHLKRTLFDSYFNTAKSSKLFKGRSAKEVKILKDAISKQRAALLKANSKNFSVEYEKMRELLSLAKNKKLTTAKIIKEVGKTGTKVAKENVALAAAKAAAKRTGSIKNNAKYLKLLGKNSLGKIGGVVGAALMVAGEVPELWSAYSEGGVGEGLKQTAKSAVRIAGAWGGAAAGAAIGSSICPVIGTAIGGFIGFWLGDKASKAVTGKSYSEKKEDLAKQQIGYPQQEIAQISQPQLNYPVQTSQNPFSGNLTKLNPNLPTLDELYPYSNGFSQYC